MLYYLASTLGDVRQDIGWREALAVVVITAAMVVIARLLWGKTAASSNSTIPLIWIALGCAVAGVALMVGIYLAPIGLMPPLKPGP
jgi:hypothetical protein